METKLPNGSKNIKFAHTSYKYKMKQFKTT